MPIFLEVMLSSAADKQVMLSSAADRVQYNQVHGDRSWKLCLTEKFMYTIFCCSLKYLTERSICYVHNSIHNYMYGTHTHIHTLA